MNIEALNIDLMEMSWELIRMIREIGLRMFSDG